MAEGHEIVFYDKIMMPTWMRGTAGATMALGASCVVGITAASGQPGFLLLLPLYAVGALTQVAKWVLRTVVTRTHVIIKSGLTGPSIPLQNIVKTEIIPFAMGDMKPAFFRQALKDDTTAYLMLGGSGKLVKITYQDGNKTRMVAVSSPHPELLRDAIEQARGGGTLAEVREQLGLKDAVVREEGEADVAVKEAEAEVEAALKQR